MHLSPNFSLEELTRSDVANRKGLENNPGPTELKNLQILCMQVLEPARKSAGGKPFRISSGYRSLQVNRAVGGSPGSYHLQGKAADIYETNYDRAKVVADCLNAQPLTDLVLIEISKRGMWIHVQWSAKPRHKVNYRYPA